MLFEQEQIVLWDLEHTSWKDCNPFNFDVNKQQFNEIIQIAAIRVNTQNFEIEDTFSCYVRPVINPKLSDFIISLTGITQKQVNTGKELEEAVIEFTNFKNNNHCFSYGSDYAPLASNLLLRKIKLKDIVLRKLLSIHFFDVRNILYIHGVPAIKFSSSSLPSYFDLPTHKAHNALEDVKAIARSLKALQDSL